MNVARTRLIGAKKKPNTTGTYIIMGKFNVTTCQNGTLAMATQFIQLSSCRSFDATCLLFFKQHGMNKEHIVNSVTKEFSP